MKLFIILFSISIWAMPLSSQAQDISYIHAGKLVDVVKGVVLENQLISLKGDKVLALEPWVGKPSGGKIIDWSEFTVLPGLIDGHTHLVGDIQSGDISAPLKSSFDEDVELGKKNALRTLLAGFTSVIDVGSYIGLSDVALRTAIKNNKAPGPRMWVAGAYITAPGGGGEVAGETSGLEIPDIFRMGVASNEGEVRAAVKRLIDGGVDFIKVIATGAVLTVGTEPGEMEFTESEIKTAVDEAQKYGKYVTAHAHGAEGIKSAVRAGVRSIQHGSLMDDEAIQLMVDHGTWLVADIYNGDFINDIGTRDGWPEETLRKNRETTDTQRQGFVKAVRAGVNIAFGTDAGVYPHGLNGRQMAYMVKYGLTPMEAIKSATIWGAEAMSLEDKIGSISKGKFADLIAVKGNPLEDISILENISGVIKGGVLYSPSQ